MFKPRKSQEEVLNYKGGFLGVSAVPGSGKTQTLSCLAARLIKEKIEDEQEVLIVTLVNSAVENFSHRVNGFIQELGLLPHIGYRVRTLHGLSHDIVRERPSLVGLSSDFYIIDDRTSEQILKDTAQAWVTSNRSVLLDYLAPDCDEGKVNWIKREQLPNLVNDIARSFIKQAKDLKMTPSMLRNRLEQAGNSFILVEMALAIYEDYNNALSYRGAVDFDDLIRLALEALKGDEKYLNRLRNRWPYILEDEAQDSSRLQEDILRLLAGPSGNWVRVGDPNQAIYETFTTANPKFLRDFIKEKIVMAKELPESGRSSRTVINLANSLIKWTMEEHPVEEIRDSLTTPFIKPSEPDDPQPNPQDMPEKIKIIEKKFTPKEEIDFVVSSLKKWVNENPDKTVAVLVLKNDYGSKVVDELKKNKIDPVELLKSTKSTRDAAGAITHIIAYLARPSSPGQLGKIYEVWRRKDKDNEELKEEVMTIAKELKACSYVEDFLWPRVDRDWLRDLDIKDDEMHIYNELVKFRHIVRRWHGTTMLPVEQLIITVAQDLFTEPSELALAHKLALALGQTRKYHPGWRLPEFARELSVIAKNERKFIGFSDEETGFDPEKYRGKVVVATMHKAKGLEWDRVHLMSVNNYDFPSTLPGDTFISEKWFIRNNLNLTAESISQLKATVNPDLFEYQEGEETIKSRISCASERLRLLYVGITRARQELIITWNNGRNFDKQPAIPLVALTGRDA